MSTYSWSYKTAVHRQVSAKRAKTEQEGPDKNTHNTVCQIESDNVVLHSQNNDAANIITPKRLNWRAKIYVGNLNKKTNEASLAYYFSVFGDIEDIKLIRDHDTKESRGFAFITFEKIESAEKAKKWCSFNYPTLDDNNITVASAERKTHKIKISKNEQRAKRDPSKTLFWEFKWTDTDDAQVYGPYETSLMQAWKNQGYFDRGCWVRQVLHRQVSLSNEKHEENTSEVTRAEDVQNTNTNTSEGSTKDESCEAGPCKKPRLVFEYSDSEDESGDGEECGRVLDIGGRSSNILPHYESEHLKLPDNEKQNDSGLTKEHLQLHENNHKLPDNENQQDSILNQKHLKSSESNHKLDSVVEMKHGERMSNSEQYEDEHIRLPERGKQEGSSVNKLHLQPNQSNLLIVNMNQKERISESLEVLNEEEKETDVNETILKHIETDHRESVNEGIHNVKMHNENQIETQEESKQKQSTSSEDNLRPSFDYEQSICNKVEENFDILQMYEQGSSVLSEHDEQGESKINDEDLRLGDYSTSEEEDIENDADDISTEFVAITEIDFNLYP